MDRFIQAIAEALASRNVAPEVYRASVAKAEQAFTDAVERAVQDMYRKQKGARSGAFRDAVLSVIDPGRVKS